MNGFGEGTSGSKWRPQSGTWKYRFGSLECWGGPAAVRREQGRPGEHQSGRKRVLSSEAHVENRQRGAGVGRRNQREGCRGLSPEDPQASSRPQSPQWQEEDSTGWWSELKAVGSVCR